MTVPWTAQGLAEEYGVTYRQILYIAKRQKWSDRLYEPGGVQWWRAKEIEEMLDE
jgi:hypothetical protein